MMKKLKILSTISNTCKIARKNQKLLKSISSQINSLYDKYNRLENDINLIISDNDRINNLSGSKQLQKTTTVLESQYKRLDYARKEIYLYVNSKMDNLRISSCQKEPWTVEWIEKHASEGNVVYDIGANIGAYSLLIAKHINNNGVVYAFEPSYLNYYSLCNNIILNDCQASVIPLQIALWSKSSTIMFNYKGLQSGCAKHKLSEVANYHSTTKRKKTTNGYRQVMLSSSLDELVKRYGLQLPEHVKLDVDGNELEVLIGAKEVLSSSAFRTLLVEIQDKNREQIFNLMKEVGLSLIKTYKRTRSNKEYNFSYCLFVSDSIKHSFINRAYQL